jgi:hypothetical protein
MQKITIKELPNINVGDEVYLYGKKTKVIGFKDSYDETLDIPHEVIIITEGRGDPFLRTFKSGNLKLVKKQEYKNTCSGCGGLYNPLDEKECDYHNSGRCETIKEEEKCKWCSKIKSHHYEDGVYCKPKPNWPAGAEHDSLTFEVEKNQQKQLIANVMKTDHEHGMYEKTQEDLFNELFDLYDSRKGSIEIMSKFTITRKQ